MHIKYLLVLAVLLAPSLAWAVDWQRYENRNAGFHVDYPADLFVTRENSGDGDGVVMKSEDGSIEFRAYAFDNDDELPLKEIREILMSPGDDREITYKRAKKNWMVISGYEHDGTRKMIFYQRLAASKDNRKLSAFEIIYPLELRKRIDPLIKRMSLSLTAPGSR